MWILAIILPPVAVLLCGKPIQALINLLLTACFWIPGVIHAFMVVGSRNADKRTDRIVDAIKDSSGNTSASPKETSETKSEPSTRKYNFTKKKLLITLMAIVIITIIISLSASSSDTKDSSGNTSASPKETSETKSEPSTPVIFSVEQASSLLLKPDDFPKDWEAIKKSPNSLVLEAKHIELIAGGAGGMKVKMIKITFDVHESESADAVFSAIKKDAQTTIDGRGFSGDKLEDVKNYPLFVWNASPQANIEGVEKWTVIGVYGNITMKVYHEGSMGAPKKNFAVDIAKKQMDRLKDN